MNNLIVMFNDYIITHFEVNYKVNTE